MKKNTHTTAVFSLMDLPSDERMKLGEQIMERALAHWRRKQTLRLSALGASRRKH
ncbi:MAG TPA: hypothetical protein VK811_05830 [Candidatus Acidoferrum sp.]|nr:hypothetical protein [Candidatus Acidoferrum sp.]